MTGTSGPLGSLCLLGTEGAVERRPGVAPITTSADTTGAAGNTATTATAATAAPSTLHQLPYEPYEFGGLEGLGEECVDPHIESALDLVLSAGTDDGEGKIPGPWIGPKPSGGAQSVQPRHDHIECHHIGPHVMHDVQAFGTIGRGHDLETLQLEIDPDQLPDDLVVVHNKHPTRRAWHNLRVGPHPPPRPGFPHFHPLRTPLFQPRPEPATPPTTPRPTPTETHARHPQKSW